MGKPAARALPRVQRLTADAKGVHYGATRESDPPEHEEHPMTRTISTPQAKALTEAHTSPEGIVHLGGGITMRTLLALADAGLVAVNVRHTTRPGYINFGRDRAYRDQRTVSATARPTEAGTAYAVEVLGLAPRVECAGAGCTCLARTEAGYCGLGCEQAAR